MTGSNKTALSNDPKTMTSAQLHTHFTKLVGDHMQDVNTRFGDTMDPIDGLEAAFITKLDAKFQEVLNHLPPQPLPAPQTAHFRCAWHVPVHRAPHTAAGVAAQGGTT
jgi:hypothetical protein